MALWNSVVHSLLVGLSVSASPVPPIQPPDGQLIALPYASNSSDVPFFANISTQSVVDNSVDNALKIACNGRRFGTPLDLESCRSVISDVVPYDIEESFGMRFTGQSSPFTCPLPYRWLSRQYFPSLLFFKIMNILEIGLLTCEIQWTELAASKSSS